MAQFDSLIIFSLVWSFLLILFLHYKFLIIVILPSFIEIKKFREKKLESLNFKSFNYTSILKINKVL